MAIPVIFELVFVTILYYKLNEAEQKLHARAQAIDISKRASETICRTIVEAHGGTIGVDSELDRGSQFWFRLKKPGKE